MRDQYIPDLTERFPEGFGGVDMTDSFFPSRNMSDEDAIWAAMEDDYMNSDDYEEDEPYEETGNAPCDDSGFCAGSSCKHFYQCHK